MSKRFELLYEITYTMGLNETVRKGIVKYIVSGYNEMSESDKALGIKAYSDKRCLRFVIDLMEKGYKYEDINNIILGLHSLCTFSTNNVLEGYDNE